MIQAEKSRFDMKKEHKEKKAVDAIMERDDYDILSIWKALSEMEYDRKSSGPYDCDTMDDWVQLVYNEKSKRGL